MPHYSIDCNKLISTKMYYIFPLLHCFRMQYIALARTTDLTPSQQLAGDKDFYKKAEVARCFLLFCFVFLMVGTLRYRENCQSFCITEKL